MEPTKWTYLPKSRYYFRYISRHPSIIQIKEKANKDVFSFRHVLPWKTYRAILSVNENKSLPTKKWHNSNKSLTFASKRNMHSFNRLYQ